MAEQRSPKHFTARLAKAGTLGSLACCLDQNEEGPDGYRRLKEEEGGLVCVELLFTFIGSALAVASTELAISTETCSDLLERAS